MKTVGITAEYNPFHNGHKYHIEESKRISGADKAVIIMSGSFVQRGEPACADKFTRAEWAIDHGADMVLELPDVFALSCAERFASGAVRILAGTGTVDSICFGSESGDMEHLKRAALSEGDPEAFFEAISKGLSYPAALASSRGDKLTPNDILGAEYIRAVKKYCPETEIFTVKREGSGYSDDELGGEYSSANAIRKAFGQYSAEYRMSPAVFEGLERALPRDVLEGISALVKKGAFPAGVSALSDVLLYRFRTMSADEIADLPEISEGLENLYKEHSLDSSDFSEMLSRIKSKRYTMARLKRISMNALLGVTRELQNAAAVDAGALYARVLAVKKGSEELLTLLKERARIPVVVRSSDRNDLPELAAKLESVSAKAHLIRALGQPYEKDARPDSSYRLIVR